MKNVLISNLKGGEILAQEVLDQKGSLWLAKGMTYNIAYLSKLHRLGISSIYIKEEIISKDLMPKKTFNPDLLRNESRALISKQLIRFSRIGSINIYKFEKLIFDIMNEIMDSINVIENIQYMKDYDNYTYEHSLNVTIIAIMISKEIELCRNDIYEIAMGCILHDLGKMQVSTAILNKPLTLTTEEFDTIKKHPIDGYNLVKNNKKLTETIKEIILTHHEKLDGSGYPFGISENEISTGSRICAIADVFDAMCSERPYKAALSYAESIRNIRVTMSKQLDMGIFKVLESILE